MKKEKFIETTHCTSQVHCKACRTSEKFRRSIMDTFDWDGTCPHGYTAETYPRKSKTTKQRHDPPKLPPKKEQVQNFVKAVWKAAVKAAYDGQVLVPECERERRIAVCIECAQWSNGRCAQCGCYLKAKVALATEQCPMEKWGDPTNEEG